MATLQEIEQLALPSSYRDTKGFVFFKNNNYYRYISEVYIPHYQLLMQFGLYAELTEKSLLIPHKEVENVPNGGSIILPDQIGFFTYPYEWSFDMWKDAAMLTLKILQIALQKGMILKDATPFNITFHKGRPVFIDTLSFEKYTEGSHWVAYRQFCECFLAPLLLMHYNHRDLGKLFLTWPEGIPLSIAKTLLPAKAKWNLQAYMHIWMHEKISFKEAEKKSPKQAKSLPLQKLLLIIKGLEDLIKKLECKIVPSVWNNYYEETILGKEYLAGKENVFKKFIEEVSFSTAIDLGANDGYFSFLLSEKATSVVALDIDSDCINKLYNTCKEKNCSTITPLVAELHNPSPAIGWDCSERTSLPGRLKADLVVALALVHHLAIGKNVPLKKIAKTFSAFGQSLIIEFVPKEDEKVKLLLRNREDIFDEYNLEAFKKVFSQYYFINKEEAINGTHRTLYLMTRL